MKIVFDTFAWIEYFLGTKKGKVVRDYLKEEVITPFIVLLELSYRADKEGWDLKQFLNFIKLKSRIANINEEFILDFGKLYNQTKSNVPKIGMADIIVLLTAQKENAKILTGDEHFRKISEVIFLE